jgi:5-bromo-4-chloroindolyl phosphate hydrolysis protein
MDDFITGCCNTWQTNSEWQEVDNIMKLRNDYEHYIPTSQKQENISVRIEPETILLSTVSWL